MRTASRIDANQPAVVKALRAIGATVLHTHVLKNCFDILVGYRGRTFLMEIKVSEKEKLTDGETEFQRTWRGSTYHVVYTPAQAIAIVTARPGPTTCLHCAGRLS